MAVALSQNAQVCWLFLPNLLHDELFSIALALYHIQKRLCEKATVKGQKFYTVQLKEITKY